jgi:type IV fimbrial biogenesis protein FimT
MLSNAQSIKSTGFSLTELLVTISILGILTAVAMPSFQVWIQNSQIKNAAESIQNGLQRARAEAVARNANVEFLLGVNSSWTVHLVGSGINIDSRASSEGSSNVTRSVVPATATTITFNSLGGIVANADASASFTQINLTTATGTRPLRVTIGIGGNIRMCDPNAVIGSLQAC